MKEFFVWTGLVNAILSFLLGLLVYIKDPKERLVQLFTFFCFTVSGWSAGYFLWLNSTSSSDALFWSRVFMAVAIFIPIAYTNFIFVFLQIKNKSFFTYCACLVGIVFLYVDLFTKYFISGVEKRLIFDFWPIPGAIFHPFLFVWVYVIFYSTFLLYKSYRNSIGDKRLQSRTILWGMVIGYAGGITNYFLWYGVPIAPWGNILVSVYVLAVGYAVIKQRFLNIKVIATEFLTGTIVLLLLFQVFVSISTVEVILRSMFFLLVSFFGYLLIKSVRTEVKRREETQQLSDTLKTINDELAQRNLFLNALQDMTNLITRTLDFKEMTQDIVDGIATRLNYTGGILLLLSEDLKKLQVIAYTQTPLTKKAAALLPLDPEKYAADFETSNSLSVLAIKEGQIEVADKFARFVAPSVSPIIADAMQMALGVKSVVGVPIFSENSIIGVILILTNKSKDKIQKAEFQTMQALANQMGIVARNLMFYEEIRIANENLAVANERLKELDTAKSEFISIASHQLRTPLTIIKGYLSLIMEGQFGRVTPIITDNLGKIYESSERLITLVNDLLDVSRIESGRMIFDLKPIDLSLMIKSVVEELKMSAQHKSLKFSYEEPGTPMIVDADTSKLRQVVVNLIDNSIKYTDMGFVKVGLSKKAGQIIFDVVDSGIGIDPGDMGRLFQKFARGSLTLTTTGNGLGLFVGKKIIDAHKGTIGVESKGKGLGSRFYFTLPESQGVPMPPPVAPGHKVMDVTAPALAKTNKHTKK